MAPVMPDNVYRPVTPCNPTANAGIRYSSRWLTRAASTGPASKTRSEIVEMLTQARPATRRRTDRATGSKALPAPLQRPFRALVFDWDGTAVADRREDAAPLAHLLDELLRLRVWIVVVTGTNFGNVERQLCRLLPPKRRDHLLVCTNRGSEVYGFRRDGTVVQRWARAATSAEETALTAVAEAVRDTLVARTGLDVRIVYDRLNRRKIDLIPLPEWADPPKARIGALLQAVEERLHAAGLAGGLGEAVAITQRLARQHGLPDARITSDVKHIEVGLTDKGDSLAWVQRHLLAPAHVPPAAVLIAGDEFGPVAGFAGSDDRLRAGASSAVVVSVGAEPNGVPDGVLHLGGGPPRFRALLADQIRRHQREADQREAPPRGNSEYDGAAAPENWFRAALLPTRDPAWRLVERRRHPALEHETESRLAIGNGLLGVRGSLEQATSASRPRTYVAGLFDTPGNPSTVPGLVPAPDWLRLRLSLAGEPMSLGPGHTLAFSRTLDWRRGLLLGDWHHRDSQGRTVRLRTLRLASLADRAVAAQLVQLEADQITPASLDAWQEPPGDGLLPERIEPGLAVWHTAHGPWRLAMASRATAHLDKVSAARDLDGASALREWEWTAEPGHPATLTRLVAVARGTADADPGPVAMATLRRAERRGLRRLLTAHTRAWAERWSASDVVVEGDDAAQRALRFAAYHLISAANPQDEHVSIGARALTGDGYLGHVFWDTEIFLLPFYTFTWPAAARALLMYRYHTLPGARAKAVRLGYRGALYAWESTDTGEETCPTQVIGPDGQVIPILCGTREHHISADVAYAVWQYWQVTGDSRFLLAAGAEILLETGRFWASRASLEADGQYHIRAVIGPDEYHERVDDNAYTNVMARWNLERGLDVAALLQARWPACWAALRERLALTDEELAQWSDVAARLTTGHDPQSGLYEQFAGFFGLEPVDLAAYADRAAPMDVVLGREGTQHAQVIKQADVVMLLVLLWERFTAAERAANFAYYEPRCGHGSSLSPAMHAVVAARLGQLPLATRYFDECAAIDLDDAMGNAAAGVHIAALGGLWQAAVLGFGGLTLSADGIGLDPHLPEGWDALEFAVQWHGRQVRVATRRAPASVTLTLERGRPMRLHVGSLDLRLGRGQSRLCAYDSAAGRWQEVTP
jgi:trehalose/maltose hydrolase-like predicted phosphorylase